MSSDLQSQLQEILGPGYRIDRELGGAGMSRVFVATETDLDRQVVVKVLPSELSAGLNTDRFRREIQLAARLQHPHIVNLLTAGAKGSLLYYTMPFIGGENLRARLNRAGEFPVQEATKILREVADALSYAHEQGVVHRDIKPENILISGNHALVTDFGVSKALSNATAETPTEAPSLTSLGIALGTPAYMAPEQAAADPLVDARADIYALGIVGYEMLTGRTPFAGLNQQQTLAAHITTAPTPITQHRTQLPPGLAAAIMRCIEKHPADRWQTAEDFHNAIEGYAMTSGATAPSAAVAQSKPFAWTPQRIAVAAGVLGLVATAAITSTIAFRRNSSTVTVGATRQMTNAEGLEIHPAISPDGKMIAYVAGSNNNSQLMVKQLSGGRSIALTDTTGHVNWPQWKPDGSAILFDHLGHREIIPALGGSPLVIPGLDSMTGCSFSHKGERVACTFNGAIAIAGVKGEPPHVIPETGGGDGGAMASWSPDDKLIAFVKNGTGFQRGFNIGNIAPSSVWVARVDGGTPVRISDESHLNTSPVWTPDGALLFVSSMGGTRDIWLQRISSNLSPSGEPSRLTTGLNAHTISIDASGQTIAYSVFTTHANVWSTPIPSAPVESPQFTQVTKGNQTIESLMVSPDGKWITYDSNLNGNQDIFKMPIGGGEPQQLTHDGADHFSPHWSPDGQEIAFHGTQHGTRDIYVVDASGSTITQLTSGRSEDYSAMFTPDGNSVVYNDPPDSMFRVTRIGRNPDRWGQPKYTAPTAGYAFMRDGRQLLVSEKDNLFCASCPAGLYIMKPDGTDRQTIGVKKVVQVMSDMDEPVSSVDSRHLYLSIRENDGTSSIWQLPLDGDPERRLVHLTDPRRQFYRLPFGIDAKNFYFIIGDRQSDIWTMELKK